MRTIVKNGTIVTATETYQGDILLEGEKISAIGLGFPAEQADKVIEAAGMYVLPGAVDVHTHLDAPQMGTVTADDFESGTTAAAWGGTTTIVDFATQPTGGSLLQGYEIWHRKAAGKAVIDYSFHMVIRELTGQTLPEMDLLVRDEGVSSFKLYMAYPGDLMVDDGEIFKILQRSGENGSLVCMHAENGAVIDILVKKALAEGKSGPKYHALTRPTKAEAEATHRAIALAEMVGVPVYIVHLSCAEALEEVRQARQLGLPVYAETCPHYLFLSIEEYDRPGFEPAKYVMTPPLREKRHQEVLWKGLAGREVQVISTDHCPFCWKEQKEIGLGDFSLIPNGAPGIESRLQLVYDGGVRPGRITLNRMVELLCTNPARLMGLYPRKGTLAPGSDADLVIFDPAAKMVLSAKTHHTRVDYNLFEGREVTGVPVTVLSRGEAVIEERRFVGKAGRGKFIKRDHYQLV
jgi:dihydropyrimidinase